MNPVLTEAMHNAARLLSLGNSVAKVAKLLGRGDTTIRRWMGSPEFRAEVQRQREDRQNRSTMKAEALFLRSLSRLERKMTKGKTEAEQVQAAAIIVNVCGAMIRWNDGAKKKREADRPTSNPEDFARAIEALKNGTPTPGHQGGGGERT